MNKLIGIANQLNSANKAQLIAAFGAGMRGPLHIQKIRNAAAHWNKETLGGVVSLGPYYISDPIRHPSEAIFWIHPSSGDYAFCAWIEDLRLMADIATE